MLFHSGEKLAQAKMDVRATATRIAERIYRTHLTDQHIDFFSNLDWVIAGTVDEQGRPWASMLRGETGFVTPSQFNLRMTRQPIAGSRAERNIVAGRDIGLLGIMLHNRRRNRVNGVIDEIEGEVSIAVKRTFGNCNKHITKRNMVPIAPARHPAVVGRSLSDEHRGLIDRADTLFISSRAKTLSSEAAHDVDVSHRGGSPGFVRTHGSTIEFDDFAGNQQFYTIGNLLEDPRAGLLFIDFDSGSLLELTGTTQVTWTGDQRIQRKVAFEIIESIWLPNALPFVWEKLSP